MIPPFQCLPQAREEIEDLTVEFERERETLLETIREQNREMKLWEQVAELLLPPRSISKIWEKAVWDEDLEEWKLPRIQRSTSVSGPSKQSTKLPNLGGGSGEGGGRGGYRGSFLFLIRRRRL